MTSTMEGGPSAPAPASPESNHETPDQADQLILTGAEKSRGQRWNDRFERWTWKKAEAKKYGFDVLKYDEVMVSTPAIKGKKGTPDQPARMSAFDRFYAQYPHAQEPGQPLEIMRFAQSEYPINDDMTQEEQDLQELRQQKLEAILDAGPRAKERIQRNWKRYNDLSKGIVYDDILHDQNSSLEGFVDPRKVAREARDAEAAAEDPYATAREYGFNLMDRNEVNEAYEQFSKVLGKKKYRDNLRDRNSRDEATRDQANQNIFQAAVDFASANEYFATQENDPPELVAKLDERFNKLIKYLTLSPREHSEVDQEWEAYDLSERAYSEAEARKMNKKYSRMRRMGRAAMAELKSAFSPKIDWAISAHHLQNPKVWSTGATPYANNTKDNTAFEPWGEWNADGAFVDYPEVESDNDETDGSWSSDSFGEAMNLPATNPGNHPDNKGWWTEPNPEPPDFGTEHTPDDNATSVVNTATSTYTGVPPWGTQPSDEQQHGPQAPEPPFKTFGQLAENQGWDIGSTETSAETAADDDSQNPEVTESGSDNISASANRLSAPYRALERRFGTERAKQIIKLGATATGVAVAGAGAFWAIRRAAARRTR